jgi:hypothetical protein
MTVGALLFAQNNAATDYIKLAVFAARRVKEYLEIPVSLITDSPDWLLDNYPDHPFDQILIINSTPFIQQKKFYDGSLSSRVSDWKNQSRSSVYELTPYDTTLVLDSDYVINSSILSNAFNNDYDFQIYQNSFDLALDRDFSDFKRINQYSIPFYWATVFVFRKNTTTQAFFDLIGHIKENWIYFKTLYNINSHVFRNDFAFSMAIHIMNGKSSGNFAKELPGKMVYALDTDLLVSTDGNKMKFLVEKKDCVGEYTLVKTTGLDVHVMNKFSLSRYIDGGSGV